MVSKHELELRIVKLATEMLYWKKAHLKLQEQVIRKRGK